VKTAILTVVVIMSLLMALSAGNVRAEEKVRIPAGTLIPARLAKQLDSGDATWAT
jgi:hypothetical protein